MKQATAFGGAIVVLCLLGLAGGQVWPRVWEVPDPVTSDVVPLGALAATALVVGLIGGIILCFAPRSVEFAVLLGAVVGGFLGARVMMTMVPEATGETVAERWYVALGDLGGWAPYLITPLAATLVLALYWIVSPVESDVGQVDSPSENQFIQQAEDHHAPFHQS